jgi:tRNA G10  N-methylase Trm11
MRYFFEAGNFIDLSQAELTSVLETYGISRDSIKNIGGGIFLLESHTVDPIILEKVFSKLGGFIRYGEVIDDLDSFLPSFVDMKKVTFGISVIGNAQIEIKNLQKLSNDIKRYYKEMGIPSRFLVPKNKELNAAQIVNNNVLEEGFELCIFDSTLGQMYGKTLMIQDIESFVHRDLNKPVSDYDMGVLPQKLARIMCNLAGLKEGVVWDPFCGSGTILMEATMLGLDVIGSDIDLRALEASNKNIQWLTEEGLISHVRYNLFHLDIHNVERRVQKDLKRTGINAVVCEPYMGPPQRKLLSDFKAQELITDLRKLYTSLFNVLEDVGRRGFKIVIVIPTYKTVKGSKTINISEFAGKKWDVLNRNYAKGDLKWERNNSIITRNIFILSKR